MKKSEVFGNAKRTTRSQLTLPELNFDLGRSPLKDARNARTARRPNVSGTDDGDDDSTGLKTPTEKTPPKRPMSPSRGVTEDDERESKRVKRSENTSPIVERHSAEPTWHSPSRKPASTNSYASHEEVPRTPKSWRRAQSVPPQSTTPKAHVPHIDFSRMSPSPWKSPSKGTLRLMSVSPMDSIPDTKEPAVESGSSIPQSESTTTPELLSQQEQQQPEIETVHMDTDPSPSNETTLTATPVLDDRVTESSPKLSAAKIPVSEPVPQSAQDADVPMVSSPIPSPPPTSQPLPPSPELLPSETVPTTPNPPPLQTTLSDPSIRPSSPLSPLPSTDPLPSSDPTPLALPELPDQTELRRSRRRSNTNQSAESLRDSVDALTSNIRRPGSVASSIASSSSTSRLPRPSSVASSYKSTGTQDDEEAKVPKPVPKVQQSRVRGMKPKGGGTPTVPKIVPSTSRSTPEPAPAPTAIVVVPKAPARNTTTSKPTTTKPTVTAKAPVKPGGSRPAPPTGTTPIPLGGRMTRSTALRLQKREESNAATTTTNVGAPKTPSRPGSRANTNTSRPGSRAVAVKEMLVPLKGGDDEDPPSTSIPSTSSSSNNPAPPTTPGRTPGRSRSKSFSYAQPTSSSVAKSNPNSPVKPQQRTLGATARVPTFDRSRASQPPPSSTLSTLSMALEKLNMPAPSRPSTSLGFNRAKSAAPGAMGHDDSGSDDERSSRLEAMRGRRAASVFPETTPGKTKGKARDDTHLTRAGSVKPMSSAAALGSNASRKPLSRAATVGSFGASGGTQRHSELMLPPPVPKGSKAAASGKPTDNAPQPAKRINLSSGIVVGKPKGRVGAFGPASRQTATKSHPQPSSNNPGPSTSTMGAMAKPRIFGVGSFTNNHVAHRIGGRVVHKVSKPSSLPMVEGSPVKGGSGSNPSQDTDADAMDEDPQEAGTSQSKIRGPFDFSDISGEDKMDIDIPLTLEDLRAEGTTTPTNDPDGSFSSANGSDSGKGKEKAGSWTHNASRRASMASQFLSQSLSSLPKTPPRTAGSEGKGKTRAASGSYPAGSAGARTAPGALGKTSGSGAHVSAHGKSGEPTSSDQANGANGASGSNSNNSTPNGTTVPTAGSLKVLKGCKIFVDVRSDDGDDAGPLFVDMLEGMGAKVLGRVGSTCTHIVYKNGLSSTVTKYKLHEDPKPLVVGIAWVVECVEKRTRVDESKFLINLDLVNVAGTTKRRKSMLPKHLMKSPVPPSVKSLTFQEGNSRTEERSSSPHDDEDSPMANTSSASLDDLPPLERARRRTSTLFNHGITRT